MLGAVRSAGSPATLQIPVYLSAQTRITSMAWASLAGKSCVLDVVFHIWYTRAMDTPQVKPLRWVGSAREDLRAFPPAVRRVMGTALYLGQTGGKHPSAKPLKGILRGAGVLEVVEDHVSGTYRTVYTVAFAEVVYVLHAFQKKSKKRIKTPRHEIELIRARCKEAQRAYEAEFRMEIGG